MRAPALVASALLLAAACSAEPEARDVDLAPPASGLAEVVGFGANAGGLKMYVHAPAAPATAAALLVALHGCTLDAASHAAMSGWNTLADERGFYVVYPETSAANNQAACFNWFLASDASRGAGEAASIAEMVDRVKADHAIDPARVFVTGLSAGGAMAAQLLGAYPDVYAGGAIMAGLPAGCASSQLEVLSCMNGTDHSPSEWRTRAEALHPGYAGARPRVAVFHGAEDAIVAPANLGELVEQWTALHGLDQTADTSTTISTVTIEGHGVDGAGRELVRSYLFGGMAHGIAVDPGTGPGQGGMVGAYAFDQPIWSSFAAAEFLGL